MTRQSAPNTSVHQPAPVEHIPKPHGLSLQALFTASPYSLKYPYFPQSRCINIVFINPQNINCLSSFEYWLSVWLLCSTGKSTGKEDFTFGQKKKKDMQGKKKVS